MTLDFDLQFHGSISLLRALTERAQEWVNDNLPDDRMTFGDAVVIEHRYVDDIVKGAQADGMMFEETR